MEKRKNTPEVVEGNAAAVQKEESKFTKFMRIKRNLSICFNFVYIIAYMAFTVFSFAGDNAGITWLPYVFGGFIVVYAALFIASLALAKNDRRKANTVKDYKSGFKIVKKLLKLVNLVLAIALVVNAVSGSRSIFSLILSCVSVLFVVFQIISEIRKMIKRRKQLAIKEKKDECDKKFIDDVKQIWNGEDKQALPEAQTSETAVTAEEGAQAAAVVEESTPAKVEKKSGVAAKMSELNKKINEVKKSANDKVEAVKSTAEKAKKISARAKEYYGERKKIDEEMSGKKKKKDDKK